MHEGQSVKYFEFGQAQVAASQTAVALPIHGAKVVDGTSLVVSRRIHCAGHLVSMTAVLSGAATAGTCKVEVTRNGTVVAAGLLTINTSASAQKLFSELDKVKFVSGDLVGVKITTSGAWDGTARDLIVELGILLEGWNPN